MSILPGSKSQLSFKLRLTNDATYATTLIAMVIDTYGWEALEWTPETIRRELEEDFAVTVPACTIDKIASAITILTTDLFFVDVWSFIQICNILSGDTFDPNEFDPADSYEMAWAITEAILLNPPEEDEEPFSEDVRRYIGAVLEHEAISDPPDVLRLAISNKPGRTDIFNDYPEAYNVYVQKQKSDREGISNMLEERLHELFEQLETTPMKGRASSDLLTKMRGSIKKKS